MLRLAHTIPLGQKKTTNRVLKKFYWPHVFQDLKQYCQTCPECQQTMGKKFTLMSRLISLPIVETPFNRIGMDIIGPLEKSRRGNR